MSGAVEDVGWEWTVQDRRIYCRTCDSRASVSVENPPCSAAHASLLVISYHVLDRRVSRLQLFVHRNMCQKSFRGAWRSVRGIA